MSIPAPFEPAGSWAQALRIGALVPTALVTVPLIGQLMIEGYKSASNPWELLYLVFPVTTAILAIGMGALLIAAIFIAAMSCLEQNAPKPLTVWIGVALLAATPLAFLSWQIVYSLASDAERTPWQYLDVTIPTYGLSIIGAFAARRARHGSWL